jgi:uncharacterized protein YqhQ
VAAEQNDNHKKSDLSRAYTEDGYRKTHVGGQALLEGVMMRGTYNWAVGVRTPEGEVYTEEHDLASGLEKNKWMYWPLIRGCRALVESLTLGYRALEIATQHAFGDDDDEEQNKNETSLKESSELDSPVATEEESEAEPIFGKREMIISLILGVFLAVALFVVIPAVITNLIVGEYDQNTVVWNIVDGILRVFVFVFYLWLVGRMKDIQRMFGYHGAEHKTIHCYEHGLELTPENAKKFPRLHVRCGTAFMIMVMIIAIFVYSVTPINSLIAALGVPDGALKLILVICVRILLLPLIAGISYEITVKWAGSRPDNLLVKILLWPGMQMQFLTTREPDDSQIECAIAAMQCVLEREELEAGKTKAQEDEPEPSETVEKGSPNVILS